MRILDRKLLLDLLTALATSLALTTSAFLFGYFYAHSRWLEGVRPMVTVRIPPILWLRVEGTGLQLDALKEKAPLELGEGRRTLRVVSNTAWTLRIEVSGEPLRLIEGQGRAEIALTVPPGANALIFLRPRS